MLERGQCAFCGGGPISAEHIWPRWLGKLAEKDREAPFKAVQLRKGQPIREFKKVRVDAKVGMFCEGCNNTWMSALETEVQPLLEPMFRGKAPEALELSVDQQLMLARWAYKSALVQLAEFPEKAPDKDVYERFNTDRFPPLAGCAIWLSGYEGDLTFKGDVNRFDAYSVGTIRGVFRRDTHRASMITNVFGAVVLQTLLIPTSDQPITDGSIGDRGSLIWPPRKAPAAWPPKHPFRTLAEVHAFVFREGQVDSNP